ncbi:MAG TPA: tRNA pseudouridine(13) synthase TruD [Polyangiaceae bacterium]|jgi:tRNA pseudouridine13 synthase|nr:MAG: tRNA pseudouridine synthase D [Deltaproteobacteria bacterium ADurb.Bin207]HNS96717.1 tRNA pseudouridine(13) synthase TruD [Polyangiaceae bacterium]HNZ22426.1 tRNA pseudouridine(13) synthase TruD [Polyangiaceae bacterium]HOD20961.1 tRNA pseudouridine(13) synthase TruD [Polyangiaceae bacterium]HOE48320.1 tRNA pseudouridine(13) synthase TruD [Polyangiaceae bacterium]
MSFERSRPSATIRSTPSDFIVEELALYEPSGSGGHVFLRLRKTGWSTAACARRIAQHLGIANDAIGHAGLKDRHAVTEQTLSFPWPESAALPSMSELASEGIEALQLTRHPHKLRVGHLAGNRFTLVLRNIVGEQAALQQALETLKTQGVPNAFGPQRFGRDGNNPEQTLQWLRGQSRGPKDKRIRRLLLSSVQSLLFDRLLEKRVQQGTWNTVVAGDLVKTTAHGGLFLTEDPETDARRALVGEVSATGPIFGPRMRWPQGEPAQWEKEVLESSLGGEKALEALGKAGAGSRRALRVLPSDLDYRFFEDEGNSCLWLTMVLPKGAYATTVLGSVFVLEDGSEAAKVASGRGTVADSPPNEEMLDDTGPSSR